MPFTTTNRLAWVTALCLCALAGLLVIQDAGARTLEQIKALGVVSICANPDALPYSSNKPDVPGFQIEIAQAVSQGLGVRLNVDWVVPRRRVAEVNCDMLLDIVNDPAFQNGHRLLSIPYQRTGISLALGQNAAGVNGVANLEKGQKIGAMAGSLAGVVLGKQGVSISPYAFQLDMLEAVEKGELFGAAISTSTLEYYVKQRPDAGLRGVKLAETNPELGWTVSIGLRYADQALLDEVNKIIAALLVDGSIARIYTRYGVQHNVP